MQYTDEGSHCLSLLGQQNSNKVSFIFSNIQNNSVLSLYLDSEKAQSLVSGALMELKA